MRRPNEATDPMPGVNVRFMFCFSAWCYDKNMTLLVLLASLLQTCLPVSFSPDTYVQTSRHLHDKHYHDNEITNSWLGNGSNMTQTFHFDGWFIVSKPIGQGDPTDVPWTSPFDALCDNEIDRDDTWTGVVPSGYKLVSYRKWYLRGPHVLDSCGVSGHLDGGEGDGQTNHEIWRHQATNQYYSRTLRERVCDDNWWEIEVASAPPSRGS